MQRFALGLKMISRIKSEYIRATAQVRLTDAGRSKRGKIELVWKCEEERDPVCWDKHVEEGAVM